MMTDVTFYGTHVSNCSNKDRILNKFSTVSYLKQNELLSNKALHGNWIRSRTLSDGTRVCTLLLHKRWGINDNWNFEEKKFKSKNAKL